jgi:hypothetical protein
MGLSDLLFQIGHWLDIDSLLPAIIARFEHGDFGFLISFQRVGAGAVRRLPEVAVKSPVVENVGRIIDFLPRGYTFRIILIFYVIRFKNYKNYGGKKWLIQRQRQPRGRIWR